MINSVSLRQNETIEEDGYRIEVVGTEEKVRCNVYRV